MATLYSTWVVAVSPAKARRLVEECDGEDLPVRAADGRVLFRPGIDKDFDPRAIARASDGIASAAQVEVPSASSAILDVAAQLGLDSDRHGHCIGTWRNPLGSMIDRRVAIPAGLRFLEGRACTRMRPVRQRAFAEEWATLLEGVGGARGLEKLVEAYLSGDDDENAVKLFVRAIDRTLKRCAALERDLFIVNVDVSD